MFFEDDDKKYKLVAPDVDTLLRYFDERRYNPVLSTPELLSATDKLWDILEPLATHNKNNEAKSIWLKIPRGTIEDYDSFEELKKYGEVETYEEYEHLWQQDYPDEYVWYELVVVKSYDLRSGELSYHAVNLDHKSVISASIEERCFDDHTYYAEGAAVKLCELIIPAVQESIRLLQEDKYNDLIEKELPYQFRTGVIKRKDLWVDDPEQMKFDLDRLSSDMVDKFKKLITSGINNPDKIGRIKEFSANDFFNACKIGYEAIGKDCSGFTLPELYQHYSDGRDEGLTGIGHGLNEGPGIDFTDPHAWDEWYNDRNRSGGHPWEVVPSGNSTHMELYVLNDKRDLDYDLRVEEITQAEYDEKIKSAGYYFNIAGIQRAFEPVSFYLALTNAGLPVVISGAEELLARFEASDWVGVVPHYCPTRYCEDLFPDEYGDIIDFTHVYKDEDKWFSKITWLPEEPAMLI